MLSPSHGKVSKSTTEGRIALFLGRTNYDSGQCRYMAIRNKREDIIPPTLEKTLGDDELMMSDSYGKIFVSSYILCQRSLCLGNGPLMLHSTMFSLLDVLSVKFFWFYILARFVARKGKIIFREDSNSSRKYYSFQLSNLQFEFVQYI